MNSKGHSVSDADERALARLEEMWDRQILRGDDDLHEITIRSTHEGNKDHSDSNDDSVKQRRRTSVKL